MVITTLFSYQEAMQLTSSCMLNHVRGSALSDGHILGFTAPSERERARECVRSVSFGCVPFVCNAKAVCGCSINYACVSLHSCTHRSKGVKLDGGLLKVIMSKVPFSQDER